MFTGKIVDITADNVVLTCADGQTLRMPIEAFEGTPKVGLEASLIAAVLGSEDAGRTKLAQALLNELLKE